MLCTTHYVFYWMIRFAHSFGAILRMFSALRAPSGLRRMTSKDVGICQGENPNNRVHVDGDAVVYTEWCLLKRVP